MDRLQKILSKIHRISAQLSKQKVLIHNLEEENSLLKSKLDELKTTNFELKKKFDIANMANQFHAETQDTIKLKRKLDKYIKEVDQVIEALKQLE